MIRVRDRLLTAVDLAATFTLAVECAVIAVHVDLDLFGILVLAFVGSVGGGVMRDLLLGEAPPAAFRDWRYAALAVLATIGVIAVSLTGPIGNWTPPLALDLFEAVGLALAAVAGTQKSLDYGLNSASVVVVATVNGCGGGILRDVLTNRLPHVLHADFYATAALLGSAVMVLLVRRLGVSRAAASIVAGGSIIALRSAALFGNWSLPHLR